MRFLGILFYVLLSLPSVCCADYYFNSNCLNNGDGTSWSCAGTGGGAGAWNNFPQDGHLPDGFIWERTTYWLAGSSTAYSGIVTFRRESGTGDITIKKATASTHGAETGWNSSYGTDQAVLDGYIQLWLSDITIDGSYRSAEESGYGLKLQTTGNNTIINTVNNIPITGITIKYVELTHTTFDTSGSTAISLFGNGNNVIQYVYAHDLTGLCFKGNKDLSYNTHSGFENIVIEESVCGRIGRTNTADHTELMKDDGAASGVIIRNNLFYDWKSTGGIVLSSGQTDWIIYNNIFTQRTSELTCGNGVITALTAGSGWENIKVFNNTFANISSLNAYVFANGFGDMSGIGNEVKNNLFWNIDTNPNICTSGCTAEKNWYSDVPLYTPIPAEFSGTGDPFVSSSTEDYRLSSNSVGPVNIGDTLSTYFTTDKNGVIRPQGAGWDIGSYEFNYGTRYAVRAVTNE